MSKVIYQGYTSKQRNIRAGVPQGSALSPDIFNFVVHDQPASAALHEAYADDSYDGETLVSIDEAATRLTSALGEYENWADQKHLSLAPGKSTVSLFTLDTHQSTLHPPVLLSGSQLPLDRTPRLLGVKFDTHFSFGPHCKEVASKARGKVSLLKSLAGSTWGASKEVISVTFKALVKSTLNYSAPIWAPNVSPTSIERL